VRAGCTAAAAERIPALVPWSLVLAVSHLCPRLCLRLHLRPNLRRRPHPCPRPSTVERFTEGPDGPDGGRWERLPAMTSARCGHAVAATEGAAAGQVRGTPTAL
jgi:hypothetical protein